MSETIGNSPETEAKQSHGFASYVVWAFVIVVIYVLSSGPMLRLVLKKAISDKAMIVYEPLGWIYKTPFLRFEN